MTRYSQNFEQDYILEYFKGQRCYFLEIGSFHPFTFSNTRALVELGNSGVYVEPSPKCMLNFKEEYLKSGTEYLMHPTEPYPIYTIKNKFPFKNYDSILYGAEFIYLIEAAIGSENKIVTFYESGGDAIGTTSIQHKEKWELGYNAKFYEISVNMISMEKLLSLLPIQIDFLNLDVEGTNIELFNLIPDWFWTDLKMLCIEHDSQIDYIIGKLQPFGFKELHRNGENLIMVK